MCQLGVSITIATTIHYVEILRYLRPQLTLAEVSSSISSFQVHVDAGLNFIGVSISHICLFNHSALIKPWNVFNTVNITRVEMLRYLRPQPTSAEVSIWQESPTSADVS